MKILAALLLAACTTALVPPAAGGERVTQKAWIEATMQAARFSGGALRVENAKAVSIWHMPIADIRAIAHRYAHAAAWRPGAVYFDEDRPWQSDRGHHFAIVIHEAAHNMQPPTMLPACREAQAHAIQSAWLIEQGETRRAAEIAAAGRYDSCRL